MVQCEKKGFSGNWSSHRCEREESQFRGDACSFWWTLQKVHLLTAREFQWKLKKWRENIKSGKAEPAYLLKVSFEERVYY